MTTYSSNVPSVTFDASGVTLPDEDTILAGVQADMNVAFGGNLSASLSSPQGQLAQSLTAIVGDKNDQILEIANQVNPDNADGRFQDAIGRIYFLDRLAAAGTVVSGTCTGLVDTVIPAGSVAEDESGYLYYSQADGTIGSDGTVDIDFQCTTTGAITCAVGALSTIYKKVTGWDAITNTAAGTVGRVVESRADFEARRKLSVAANAVNSVQSIYAAVLDVTDVVDAYVTDNPTSTVVETGATNYALVEHSVYVAVAGGASADIATAIWNKKPPGCNYNGDTSYDVSDTSYNAPYPTYTITWVTPTALPVYFNVEIAKDAALPSDIVTQVRAAIVAAFNGTDGGVRARIASKIFAGRYYAGVAAIDTNVEIYSILLGSASPAASTSLMVGIDQRPTLDVSNITVTLV